MLLCILLLAAMISAFLAGIVWSVGLISGLVKIGLFLLVVWVAYKAFFD